MKGPRALAVFSLGLAGLALEACDLSWMTGAAQEGRRPAEPRLTGGGVYVPCRIQEDAADLVPDSICGEPRPVTANGPPSLPPGAEPVRGEEEPVVSQPLGREIGLGDLLRSGGLRDLSNAVKRLAKAAGAEPQDAKVWSDLAAVYLVRAQRADDPRDLLRAYGASHRALRADRFLPEARFNHALVLERLFLPAQAEAAWNEYLDLDETSPWAGEARARLAALRQPPAASVWEEQERQLLQFARAGDARRIETIVRHHPQAAREHAEQQLLGLWADAALEGRTDLAADRLRLLRLLGDTLVRVNGERLVKDSVTAIDAAASSGDGRRWKALAEGYRDFRDGYALYKQRNCVRARVKLEAARAALSRAGSPLAFRAAFFLACCDYLESRYVQALDGVNRLAHEIDGKPYGGLRGHVLRVKGLLAVMLGRMSASVQDYEAALAEFERLGEAENVAAIEGLLGEGLMFLGRGQEAWWHDYKALRMTPKLREPGPLSMVFMIAGNAALRDGEYAAALAFHQEWVRQSLRSNDLAAVEAITWLARIQDRVGDHESALDSLRQAEVRAARLEDEAQRRRKQADIARVEGSILAREKSSQAVDLLTSALEVYTEDENLIFSLWTLLERGRAYRGSGDDRRAERDLEAALSLYDRMGERLDRENLRLALVEEMDSVFDEMVALQASRDPERAFAYADRARTRVLPGSASKLWTGTSAETGRLLAAEPRSLPLDEIRGKLPENTSLVQYSVLEDRVLIWLVRRDGEDAFFQRQVRREDLESQVAALRAFESDRWKKAARDLFDLLVRPWLPALHGEERIVFIPDKVLHRVPFAALQDPSSKEFLVETHPLAVAPSATLYVNALGRQAAPGSGSRGLVVGEPAMNRKLFPLLVPLPAAAAEASRLASSTGAVHLEGGGATKSAFLLEAAQAEWIHFSGHAVVEPGNSLLSKLVLAPEGENDPGALTAQEIYAAKLDGTRLVVLAACDTGDHYVPGNEGATSLARAFLAAGVPTVVASLWSVEDEATARLFDAFHTYLRAGDDPVDALRKAQREMIEDGEEKDRIPSAWSAFQVIGASID